MPTGHSITLRHNGKQLRGLLRGEVTLGLEQIAHPFSFSYAERLANTGTPWHFEAGDLVSVHVDGEMIVDGYIDVSRGKRAWDEMSFEVQGRAATADLVDCTAMVRPRQFTNATVVQIVSKIVQPFGFAVRLGAGAVPGAPFRRFTIDKNDTCFSAISKACKQRGLWPRYIPGATVLELAALNATPRTTPLVLGENVLSMERETNHTERFGSYHFSGTTHATDTLYGPATRIKAQVFDPAITRHRPLRIDARNGDGPSDVGVRARLERNHRAGNSERVKAVVSGWRYEQIDGDPLSDRSTSRMALWEPNTIHAVIAPELGLNGVELLIVSARYVFDAEMKSGFVCELELKRREALDPMAAYPVTPPRTPWT
jgi:prophage tail gpP-like protein